MPNMSYCRFENTYNDLVDCLRTLKEEGFDRIESQCELDAAENLMKVAARYVEVYRGVEEMKRVENLGITPDECEETPWTTSTSPATNFR